MTSPLGRRSTPVGAAGGARGTGTCPGHARPRAGRARGQPRGRDPRRPVDRGRRAKGGAKGHDAGKKIKGRKMKGNALHHPDRHRWPPAHGQGPPRQPSGPGRGGAGARGPAPAPPLRGPRPCRCRPCRTAGVLGPEEGPHRAGGRRTPPRRRGLRGRPPPSGCGTNLRPAGQEPPLRPRPRAARLPRPEPDPRRCHRPPPQARALKRAALPKHALKPVGGLDELLALG